MQASTAGTASIRRGLDLAKRRLSAKGSNGKVRNVACNRNLHFMKSIVCVMLSSHSSVSL